MNVTEAFVLRSDVLLTPCADLSEDVRAKISFDQDDYTLSRRYGRAAVQVIDAEAAALLGLFREPRTIVDAVIENSRALGKDPRRWLDELLPHFAELVHSKVLVPAGAAEEVDIRPRFESGKAIGGWRIVRCASLTEDTEIHQIRRGGEVAALKIARFRSPALEALFENEIAVLRHLDGGVAPRLFETGIEDDCPWAIVEWVAGADLETAAARRRHDRGALIDLCVAIAGAYAALHARGVLHGDVHPRNAIAEERVTLVDFGYSRLTAGPERMWRAGIAYFFEPEYVAARREGGTVPLTAAGEQYSLAALLYSLITGRHYLDFRYEREEMDRQVTEDPPLPFAQHGVPPWPAVEQILRRALEKDPSRRYASVAEMAACLAETRQAAVRESLSAPLSSQAHAFLESTLQAFARGGTVFAERFPPPAAVVTHGCAGAAVGLLQIAQSRGDAELLALADVWRSRAGALIGTSGAYTENRGAREIAESSPYHREGGIHAAALLVAAAKGDPVAQRDALDGFLRSSRGPSEERDLYLGRCGSLLGAALLQPAAEELPGAAALRAYGAETMRGIWDELDAEPPLAASPPGTYFGIAHGWAGYLYAAMRWCDASGDPLPGRLRERLEELVALGIPKGRGIFWWSVNDRLNEPSTPTWCNGTAGFGYLFTLAHRMFGDGRWLELAERCAWHTWDEPRITPFLCCGTAGRAYALLNLYKHTGAPEWLSRARQLANHAASVAIEDQTLWYGTLGIAALIADLGAPESARMPFFE